MHEPTEAGFKKEKILKHLSSEGNDISVTGAAS